MIIVSQDKDNIVNFENIVSIGIEDFDVNKEICYQRITAETLGTSVALGDYKTEERAKEVLEDMASAYANMQIIKIPKVIIYEKITEKEMARNICFIMPKD